jgi:transglutaminase-like putative cysteine protease
MRLAIEHTTIFTYDQPISEAYTEMRLRPLDTGGQRCLAFGLATEPRGQVLQYTDRFGNDVRFFDVLQPHQQLSVTARSEVATPNAFEDETSALSPLDEYDYRLPSPFVPLTAGLRALSANHVVPGDPRATALALMRAVYRTLSYIKGVTDVTTTADQVLQVASGVCQDFSHVMLGLCRAQGLAARYVSGYLYAPENGTAGGSGDDVASHAWVDVFLPGEGWLALDPTHDTVQTGHYVRVAVGRDYGDVSPTRGVYRGSAQETLGVQVRVVEL